MNTESLKRLPRKGQRVYVVPERQHGIVVAAVHGDRTYVRVRLDDGREGVMEGLGELERRRDR